ncbi:MAG: hypothetical protein OXN81_05785 [Alphaproteobacteria bacterium]|nr:hypothetical protein [Alphaproteobacteria bacterium]
MNTPDDEALADIDRRLNEGGLTALDRAQLIVQRKEIWQRLHPASGDPAAPRYGNVEHLKEIWAECSELERTEFRDWLTRQGGD